MTCDSYKMLVARFCGPATTVTVPCTSPPRLCVKTLGQAVSWTGECYTAQITLFPEQVRLITMADPRVYVTGPPGTGKTVVLLLKATEWLRCGDDVYIVSTRWGSRAACSMLYHLLLHIVNTQLTSVVSPGQPHLLQYNFYEAVEKGVNDLSLAASRGSLYVIADEVYLPEDYLQTVCDKLVAKVPRLHLWAAGCFHKKASAGWHVEYLTRPIRSPPAVVREVQQADKHFGKHVMANGPVLPYDDRGVADHTDGPPVRRLYHRGHGHSGDDPRDCATCGREVARFLHSLRVQAMSTASTTLTTITNNTAPPCLQWRDVLVSAEFPKFHDQPGVVTALRESDIPVRVIKKNDIEDVATARSDVVWVGESDFVHGLERKVVVCLGSYVNLDSDDGSKVRFYLMSRCTSQLVIVSR